MQASSIQNLGVTCESISVGHNPFKLPLSARGVTLPGNRALFLCEKEFELRAKAEKQRSEKAAAMIEQMNMDGSKHSVQSGATADDDGSFLRRAGVSKATLELMTDKKAISAEEGFGAPMSASALLGAMEGILKDPSTGQPSRSLALAAVARNPDLIKDLKTSAAKPERFGRIEPLNEPFLGAWMATSAKLKKLSTQGLMERQQLVQTLYEGRYASMQRLVAFFVMFHEMGKQVQDFWPRVSGGLLGYDMSRSQSIMRIATTASPVSGMEVRLRALELQRAAQRKWAATKLQMLHRFKVAVNASDDELMVMTMLGKLSKSQLARVAAEKMRRAGKLAKRRGGVMGEGGADMLNAADDDDEPDDEDAEPKTDEQIQALTEAMKSSSVFAALGARRIQEAIDKMKEVSCAAKQVVFEQGDAGDAVYIVETGEYGVHIKQAGDRPVKKYKAGDVFGEVALLYNSPRQETVKCKAAGTLWKLQRKTFQHMMSTASKAKTDTATIALRSSQLLGGLTEEQIELVASELETIELEPGEVVGYEGKLAEAFYIVARGGVVLTRERYADGDEFDEEVGRLDAPAVFGEHSLDWCPKHERRKGSLAYSDQAEPERDPERPKMLRLASGAMIASPSVGGGSKSKKGGAAHARKTEAPPIWRDTVMANPELPHTSLLWMSREHFVEVVGALREVLHKNELRRVVDAIPVFQDLRPDQRQRFAEAIDRRHLVVKQPGELIYASGDASDRTMYIVRKGQVALYEEDAAARAAMPPPPRRPPPLRGFPPDR